MKISVIAGGTGDIGRGIAEKLKAAGDDVYVISRSKRNTIEGVTYIECDVSDEESVTAAFSDIHEIDKFVTCFATDNFSKPITETSFSEWKKLIDIDLNGVFLTNKCAVANMIKNGGGKIVNLTSFHTVGTYPNRTAYVTAKTGVLGLSQALAVEVGKHNILVNTVAPGPVYTTRTNGFISMFENAEEKMKSRVPSKKLTHIEEVANAVVFLLSDENVNITGQQLVIDGGWSKNLWFNNF